MASVGQGVYSCGIKKKVKRGVRGTPVLPEPLTVDWVMTQWTVDWVMARAGQLVAFLVGRKNKIVKW